MKDTYVLGGANLTVLADATLAYIRAATAWASRGSLLEILRVEVDQQGTTTSQQLGIILGQKATAFGTYVAATPSPVALGTIASAIAGGTAGAAATAGVNASSEGAGAVTNVKSHGFNNLNGFLWVPTPEDTIWVGPDLSFIVKLRGTPTTLTGWNVNVTFRELT